LTTIPVAVIPIIDAGTASLSLHEAMISDVQAETIMAQRALKRRSQQRGRRSPYLPSGLLRCVCGANFVGDAGYYKCHRRNEGCDSRSIRHETIEQAALGVTATI
jgi:hypothetical protein